MPVSTHAAPASVDRDWPATIGRYEIVGRLATGGMAEILLGRITGPAGFERPVVVKRILPHLARRPEFVRMLVDEARLAAQIRNDNVVQVHELGNEAGELFIVQEYLEGESAFGLIRRMVRSHRKLPVGLAASIIADACGGLQAAHDLRDADGELLGVVHRDVSPENVFVTYAGGVKLLDFGVALARDRLAETETGNIKGKFGYMSPEQCKGEKLDRRSDVFSLGVVLYELITGARLFKRPNALAAVQAICDEPIPRVGETRPDCPPMLDKICARALERNRAARYQSAAELRDELLKVIRAEGPTDASSARASLMGELFRDRVAEKRHMLERLAISRTPPEIPRPEVDNDVEVPQVEFHAAPRRRYGLWLGFAAGIGLAVGLFSARPHGEPSVPAPTTVALPEPTSPNTSAGTQTSVGSMELPSPTPPSIFAPAAKNGPTISVDISSDPAGARVFMDGQDRGATPLHLELPRSSRTAHVTVRRTGYAVANRDLVPGSNQQLRVSLERLHRAPPTPQFHRF